jgi:hypothetical protein
MCLRGYRGKLPEPRETQPLKPHKIGMKKKPSIILLVCVLSLPVPSTAEAVEDIFSIMFRMMLTMMNVMSDTMLDNSDSFDMGSGNPFGNSMGAWPLMSGMSGMSGMNPMTSMGAWPLMSGMNPVSGFGGMPGMNPWSGPMRGNSWNNPFMNNSNGYPYSNDRARWPGTGYPGAINPATANGYPGAYSSASLLNGRWFGNSGEILEVRGNRFRLRDGRSSITGTIRLENNIVSMLSPKTRTVTQYTFIRNQSELLLQDASGRVLAFRKRPVSGAVHVF